MRIRDILLLHGGIYRKAYTNSDSKIKRGDKEEATEAYILVRRGDDDEGNEEGYPCPNTGL